MHDGFSFVRTVRHLRLCIRGRFVNESAVEVRAGQELKWADERVRDPDVFPVHEGAAARPTSTLLGHRSP
jgi:hypothetical protein